MNKYAAIILLAMAVTAAQADMVDRTWTSKVICTGYKVPSYNPNPSPYDGYGWDVAVVPVGSSFFYFSNIPEPANGGWYDGYGYTIAGFQFNAMEGKSVVLRIYNGIIGEGAFGYVESIPVILPYTPFPSLTDITFEFYPRSHWVFLLVDPPTLNVFTDHGTANKHYDYGTHTWACTINSPIAEGGTNYSCTGWIGTEDAPASGTTTNTGAFHLGWGPSTITWLWEVSDFWLDVSVVGNGSLNLTNDWYCADSNLEISTMPGTGWVFIGWSGDLAGGQSTGSTDFLMDGAKSVVATFAPEGDLDSDEIDDDWEIQHFGTVQNCNPTNDPDGDLYLTIEEFRNGTDPNAWDFYLWYSGAIELMWKTVHGTNYQMQYSSDLVSNVWTNLGDVVIGNGTTSVVSELTEDFVERFYRVVTGDGVPSINVVGCVNEAIDVGGSFKIVSLNIAGDAEVVDIQDAIKNLDELNAAGSGSYANADKIYVWTGAGYKTYGLYDAGESNYWMVHSSHGWKKAFKATPSSQGLTRGSSVWYETGAGGAAAELLTIGDVPNDSTVEIDVDIFSLIAYPYAASINLQDLVVSNATASATFSNADRIYVWVGSGYNAYGLYRDPLGNKYWLSTYNLGWTKAGKQPPADVVLNLGKGVWFESVDGAKTIGFMQNYTLD